MDKDNINVDTEQVMTYNRQGIAGSTSVLPEMTELSIASPMTLDDKPHSLVDFLKRPVDLLPSNFFWTNDQQAGQELIPLGISLPNDYFKNPMISEKLRGFLGIKGKLKMRIMINAQKFQQGALMPYWIPNSDNMRGKTAMIRKSLSGKSGCAHVIINCDGGTEQDLEIPYVNQHMFHNLATGQGAYGRLFLTPFLQLLSATGTSVGIRIQMWMEDPQPQFATSAIPDYVSSQSVSQIEESKMHSSDSAPLTKGGGLDVGKIWNSLRTSKLTPSYLSRSAANVLELMGFQKPTQTASIQRMEIRPASYMANFNGEFAGHKLALAKDNELLGIDAPAGTSVDEMAINYIATIPTFYKKFVVNTLNHARPHTEGHVLFSDRVHPMKFVPSFPTGVLDSTFLGYTAASFAQWRGGLTYHFTVAKTIFHTGTLRVTFIPGVFDDAPTSVQPPPNSKWQLERCYQATFDLKEKTDFSFTVPFPSTRPFLNCINPWGAASSEVALKNYSTGTLLVDVFIPFVAPPTVSSYFEVAVWVSGAPDISFANPVAPTIFPYFDGNLVQSQSFSNPDETNRHAGGEFVTNATGQSRTKGAFEASAYCTGEVVASIKALMGRFGPFYFSDPLSSSLSLVVSPYNFATPVTRNTEEKLFDYLDYFSFLYAFYRGGVRMLLDPGDYSDIVWKIGMRSSLNAFYPRSSIPRTSIATSLPQQYIKGPSSMSLSRTSLEGFVSFEVPYYSLTHVTPVLSGDHNHTGVEESNYPLPLVTLIPRSSQIVSLDLQLYRACADDFRFMYIVGPPQVVMLPSAVDLVPYQIAPARYSATTVTRVNDDFRGLFGAPSFILLEGQPMPFEPPSQLLAITPDLSNLWCLPGNVLCDLTRLNNQVKISTSHFVGSQNLNMFTGPIIFRQADAQLQFNLLTKVVQVDPSPGTDILQAKPAPCLKFSQQVCTINENRTTINIPGQGTIAFGQLFTLTNYMIVFDTEDDNDNVAKVVLLAPGRNIELRRQGETSLIYTVYDARSVFLGFIALNVASNPGFKSNTPTPSFSEAVEIIV